MEEFLDQYKEHMEMISKGLENLAKRIETLEHGMSHMPPPGADMVKYKPEGYADHLNLAELFDDLYTRLNMLERRIKEVE